MLKLNSKLIPPAIVDRVIEHFYSQAEQMGPAKMGLIDGLEFRDELLANSKELSQFVEFTHGIQEQSPAEFQSSYFYFTMMIGMQIGVESLVAYLRRANHILMRVSQSTEPSAFYAARELHAELEKLLFENEETDGQTTH